MTARSFSFVAILPLLLASCGSEAPVEGNQAQSEAGTNMAEATDVGSAEQPAPATPEASPAQPSPPFAEVEGAHPGGPPEPAPIPARFRGIWAESKDKCPDLSHHIRLVISGATLRFPENVVRVASVEQPNANAFVAKGERAGEGTSGPAEFHYSTNAAGDRLTDEAGGGMVRVRCS